MESEYGMGDIWVLEQTDPAEYNRWAGIEWLRNKVGFSWKAGSVYGFSSYTASYDVRADIPDGPGMTRRVVTCTVLLTWEDNRWKPVVGVNYSPFRCGCSVTGWHQKDVPEGQTAPEALKAASPHIRRIHAAVQEDLERDRKLYEQEKEDNGENKN